MTIFVQYLSSSIQWILQVLVLCCAFERVDGSLFSECVIQKVLALRCYAHVLLTSGGEMVIMLMQTLEF